MIASRVVHRDVPRFVHDDVSRAVPKNIHSDGSTRAVHSNVPTAVHRLYATMYSDRIVPSVVQRCTEGCTQVVHSDVPRTAPRAGSAVGPVGKLGPHSRIHDNRCPNPKVAAARMGLLLQTASSLA